MGMQTGRNRRDSWGIRGVKVPKEPLTIGWQPVLAGVLLIVLLLEAIWYFVLPSSSLYQSTQNQLAVGREAKAAKLDIPIYGGKAPVAVSVSELQHLRREIAEKHEDLLAGQYQDFDLLFTNVTSGKPWWSVEGYYFTGKSPRLIEGTPAELLGIANPFLLVVPDFTGLSIRGRLVWDGARTTPAALAAPDFPFRPEPQTLEWYPVNFRADVKYSVSNYIDMVNRWTKVPLNETDIRFDAVPYNALEFGYRYAALRLKESSNVLPATDPALVAPLFLTYVNSADACGNPEGCNVRASLPRQLVNIRATSLPAAAVFGLWKQKPKSAEVDPDFRFAIIMK